MNFQQIKDALTAPDKIAHMKGGTLILVAAIVSIVIGITFKLHPITAVLIMSGFSGAVSIEGAQASVNKNVPEGQPKPHEVSILDAFVTMLPTLIPAIAIEVIYRLGHLPAQLTWAS